MSRRVAAVRLLSIAALTAAAACSDSTTPSGAGALPVLNAVQVPEQAVLARTVPGFGGFFFDEGVPTVYLTDVAQRGAVARALGISTGTLQVRSARYAYRQLDTWFQRVSYEAFEIPGVVFADLDEAHNVVLVGVEHRAAAASVRGLAARLGLPAQAFAVREVEPISYMATLRDQVRPVVAGLQINFSNFLCSIGFNATSGGQASFVTASHCTDRQGGVEGTQYFQSLASQANSFIGTEVADPDYVRNSPGCPRGKKCRLSDAARAAYATGVSNAFAIASTSGPNNGSLTITGTFSVTGKGTAAVGATVNKIGRTTGWTQGRVSQTCVTTGVLGSNVALICQTFVDAGVGGGDSGSDVFALSGSSATLLGVLWGGNSAGTLFVYSPMSGIEAELGTLTVN
ncbi:MAG TPA: hypothetical protein VGQ06_00705 [Gemmatimonadales bacterium]|jgi:hypothetical protein|nr:hypothetical protein [Gemmatimonadales bacterium]